MSEESVVFELTAKTLEVSLPSGKVLKPGDTYKASPEEIPLLRATSGLKEVHKESSSSTSKSSSTTSTGKGGKS